MKNVFRQIYNAEINFCIYCFRNYLEFKLEDDNNV